MILTYLNSFFLLSMPGGSEWILILLVVLLFFGGRKIPDLMRGIGRGVREFNDAKTNVKNEIEAGMSDKDKKEQELKVQQAQASQMQQAQAPHLQTELPK
jgi:sec-independent protein translocase protein TatA